MEQTDAVSFHRWQYQQIIICCHNNNLLVTDNVLKLDCTTITILSDVSSALELRIINAVQDNVDYLQQQSVSEQYQ
jgi:hypothetical protein